MVANLNSDGGADYLRQMFAWMDPDADPDTKSAYKFPNHMVSADGSIGAANLAACSAGIGALNGARGGSSIPEADRKGVYNHLAKHLADGGKDAPELASEHAYRERLAEVNRGLRKPEWKSYSILEFKADDAAPGEFSGYASTWSKDVFGDKIQPGAFGQTIAAKKGMVPIFFNHSEDNWIGFSTGLAEDHKGLVMQAALALESSSAADVYALLKAAGQIDFPVGLSIGFVADDWEWDDDSHARLIKSVDLWEVSITPFPANKRSFVDDVKSVRTLEKRLRDAGGFSAAQSKRILALLDAVAAGGPAVPPSAPARDVREVRKPAVITPLRETLWSHLL
jgi:HK97 family phage prohead protease